MSNIIDAYPLLLRACQNAESFPDQAALLDEWPPQRKHHLQNHLIRLKRREQDLFQKSDGTISLNFLELNDGHRGFKPLLKIRDLSRLQEHLGLASDDSSIPSDPRCRFMFIWGGSSRSQLYTSKEALMTVFTYLQVLPSYLDFIYPFGIQQYPQDAFFNTFKADSLISQADRGTAIDKLARSGRSIKLCYSLKSVESIKSSDKGILPWSIRQSSIYHSFDIETGTTNWVAIKGDDTLMTRMNELAKSKRYQALQGSDSADRLFLATFEAHLVICDWAAEQWRWYLNCLEEEFQVLTRESDIPLSRRSSPELESRKMSRAMSFGSLIGQPDKKSSGKRSTTPPSSRDGAPEANGAPAALQEKRVTLDSRDFEQRKRSKTAEDVFRFEDLQSLQFLEEKVIEASLVLESNAKVMRQIREYYQSLLTMDDWPDMLGPNCRSGFAEFDKALKTEEDSILLQKDRAETLLRVFDNRKSTLHGILEYRNIEASQEAMKKAQESTNDMRDLTKKTTRQTDLMALIALVTIVFLPGTFVSTVMSTDIVHWDPSKGPERIYSWPALKTFLIVSLPLTSITFLLCISVYFWWKRREMLRQREQERQCQA